MFCKILSPFSRKSKTKTSSKKADFGTVPLHRFTLDWLIRFVELHPHDRQHFDIPRPFVTFYKPHQSHLAKISPFFYSLVNKHLPHLHFPDAVAFKKGNPIYFTLSNSKRRLVVIFDASVYLNDDVAGTIQNLLDRKVLFNSLRHLSITNSCLSFDEFKVLMDTFPILSTNNMKFTEPVNFSTVWPLLKNCKQFELNITNLVYDKNMATTMPLHRPMIASWVAFRNLPVSVYVVMPIINYFSTNPNFPQCVVLTFLPGTTFSDLQPLIKTAQEKMHDSGVMFNKSGEHVSINNGQQPPENDNAEIKDVVLRVTPEGWYQVDYYLPL